jgi:hypothetical protein
LDHDQRLPVQRVGLAEIALADRDEAQEAEQHPDALLVPELAPDRQALLVMSAGCRVVGRLFGTLSVALRPGGFSL